MRYFMEIFVCVGLSMHMGYSVYVEVRGQLE